MVGQPPAVVPCGVWGFPTRCAPSARPGFHCSLQVPVSHTPVPAALQAVLASLFAHYLSHCHRCCHPPSVSPTTTSCLVSRHFVPPSGFIQRTASFLQRGSNSRSLPGPCSRFAFRRGAPAQAGQASPLQEAVTSPVAFCGGWWTRGSSGEEVWRARDWRLAVSTALHAGTVSQGLGEGQGLICSQEDGDEKFPKTGGRSELRGGQHEVKRLLMQWYW